MVLDSFQGGLLNGRENRYYIGFIACFRPEINRNKRASAGKLERLPTQLFCFNTNTLSFSCQGRPSKSEKLYTGTAQLKMKWLAFLALTLVTPLNAVSKYVICKLHVWLKFTLNTTKLYLKRILITRIKHSKAITRIKYKSFSFSC